jgi:hypothetical protein
MKIFDKIKEMGEFAKSIKNPFGSGTKAGNFLITMKNRMGIGSPERNATDTYEREMAIVPKCISANENEIPVKQYNIAILRNLLKFERAEGRIQVTNKRVIFRAAGRSVGGRTTLQHEFAVNEIAGIEAKNNYKFSFLYLIFAILIITLAFLIIYRPPITGIASLMSSQSDRISNIMYPKHVQKAFSNEMAAISRTRQAEKNVTEAGEKIKLAYEKEEAAGLNVRNGIQRTRRVQSGTTWWGEPTYTTETYRDRTPAGLLEAQNALDSAIDERERFQAEERRSITELETARVNEAKAIKSRGNTVMTWRVLITLFGFILGVICLIPFFVLYKRFGLKLFILNFSIFGFALALMASGFRIFILFLILSIIITLVCIFIFCFRPNLVISIKNKMGSGEGPINIRCNENLNRLTEVISFGILFLPLIIILGMNAISDFSDDMVGSILQIALPVILLIILLVSIIRIIQSNSNYVGIDSGFAEVFPVKETESAIREIGAMIGDSQKLGDLGLEKWIQK